jgi:hypothetical protein
MRKLAIGIFMALVVFVFGVQASILVSAAELPPVHSTELPPVH